MYFVLLEDFTWQQIKYRQKQTKSICDGGWI